MVLVGDDVPAFRREYATPVDHFSPGTFARNSSGNLECRRGIAGALGDFL